MGLSATRGHKAVFFDRDDTLMVNVPYLNDPALVQLYPDTKESLARLVAAGYLLFIVSNQSGIGRGLCTEAEVEAVRAEFLRQVAPVKFTHIYYSPHTPEEPSLTRKPAPGLLHEAVETYGLDLAASFMVGDKESDVLCGHQAPCRTVRLWRVPRRPDEARADFETEELTPAVDWILAQGNTL